LDWETLKPDNEPFSVLMPKGSTFESSKDLYHKIELNTRIYLSKNAGGPIFAVVSLSGIKSNPALYTEMQRVNSYVDAFKNLFPPKVRGKEAIAKLTLVGEKTLQGNAGREYRMNIGDLSGTARVYATRKRFYAIAYLNAKKDDSLQDKFLSSFILPEPSAQVATNEEAPAAPNEPSISEPVIKPARGESNPGEIPAAPSATVRPEDPDPNASGTEKRPPISGGVLNRKAISLPAPEYPTIARQARAAGTVVVRVTIDEDGNVIAAQAVSGHPLLQAAAVTAARQARFSPTLLMGEPVKVVGVITYNFVAQ
jgi:TonB family protein